MCPGLGCSQSEHFEHASQRYPLTSQFFEDAGLTAARKAMPTTSAASSDTSQDLQYWMQMDKVRGDAEGEKLRRPVQRSWNGHILVISPRTSLSSGTHHANTSPAVRKARHSGKQTIKRRTRI